MRWVDVTTQGDLNPKYRSRFSAKEANRPPKPELYAATPPPGCFRMAISSVMGPVAASCQGEVKFMVCVVLEAYSYALAIRSVYVKIVDEDFEPGDEARCGRLNVPMYEARNAARNWYEHYREHLQSIGFTQRRPIHASSTISTLIFMVFIHGSDYVASGPGEALKWMAAEMQNRYGCTIQMPGPDENDNKQIGALNRIITWQMRNGETMIIHEADPRHSAIIVKEFGFVDAKALATPITKIELDEDSKLLDEFQCIRYRSLVARANYLAAGRSDIKFACGTLGIAMAKPKDMDWELMRRLGGY